MSPRENKKQDQNLCDDIRHMFTAKESSHAHKGIL